MIPLSPYTPKPEWVELVFVIGSLAFLFVMVIIALIGIIMIELAKAKHGGVDVDGIISDARRRAYRRGRDPL